MTEELVYVPLSTEVRHIMYRAQQLAQAHEVPEIGKYHLFLALLFEFYHAEKIMEILKEVVDG